MWPALWGERSSSLFHSLTLYSKRILASSVSLNLTTAAHKHHVKERDQHVGVIIGDERAHALGHTPFGRERVAKLLQLIEDEDHSRSLRRLTQNLLPAKFEEKS